MTGTTATTADKAGTSKGNAPRRVTRAPSPLAPGVATPDVRQAAGNLAVQRLLRSGAVQAKLAAAAPPGDPHEPQADRAAERSMPSAHAPLQIHRKCASCAAGGQCPKCEEEETLRAKASPGRAPRVSPGVESSVASLRGGGRPLPASVRAFFEPRLGRDFSQVRVHTGGAAAESARAINALAYTVGRDVVFAPGRYAPEATEGKRLLAHELAHVAQQADGSPSAAAAEAASADSLLRRQPDPAAEPSAEPSAEPNQSVAPPEPNQSVAPPEGRTSTEPASLQDRNAAQERLMSTGAQIRDQTVATSFWIASQWSKFIAETTSSPLRSWHPGMLKGALGLAGILIGGEIADKITVGLASVPGLPAKLASFVLTKLVGFASEKISNAITGKPTEEKIRTDERKRTGEAAVRKLSEIHIETESALAASDVALNMVRGKLAQDISTEDLDAINRWIDQQSADAQARPQGDSLYLTLLERWAYEQAENAADPKSGVDPAQWKEANKTLFGTETMPRKHFYLHQLQNFLQARGVPTDTVDAWLAAPASSPTGVDDLSWGGSAVISFDHATDPKLFADSVYAPGSPQHKHIAEGRPFRGMLEFWWNVRARMGFENLGLDENVLTSTNFVVDLIGEATPAEPGAPQPKLAVSQPGDPYEREADRVAETVMRMPAAQPAPEAAATPQGAIEPGGVQRAGPELLQRKCSCEEEPGAGGSCEQCREKELQLQRRAGRHDGAPQTREAAEKSQGAAPKVNEALRSGGRPLDAAARAFFEPRFGRDLGGVRVHADADASASAESINALAYTVGRDIVFGAGQYDPGSQAGRQLLAHELTHVIQQDFGSVSGAAVHAPLVQRQPPAGNGGAGQAGEPGTAAGPVGPLAEPGEQAETPDTQEPIQPPPEHEDRLLQLDYLRQEIDEETRRREGFQEEYRGIAPASTSPEEDARRDALKSELTSVEQHLVSKLEERIAVIGDAILGLESVLPGSSPQPPTGQTSPQDEPAGSDYTIRSEITRLDQERRRDQAQLVSIKRCLSRKRLREIKADLAKPDISPELREELEAEKAKETEFMKRSAADVKCAKSPADTKHPTEVSARELELIKKGECYVPFPYIAEEGKGQKSGGCTIGYGHVIRGTEAKCSHGTGEPIKHACGSLLQCDCSPSQSWSPEKAETALKEDISAHTKYIKAHVFVDLDQGQFDALVDLSLHRGSLSPELLKTINSELCTDDEAVRQQYLKSDLYIKNHHERGPVFEKRRKERVWAPKGDDDPTCI